MSTAIYEAKVETLPLCDCCEREAAVAKVYTNIDNGTYYCKTCISESHFKCCTCKKYFNKDEVTETPYYQDLELKDNELQCLMCDYEGEQNYQKGYEELTTLEDPYQEWREDYYHNAL